MKRAVTLRFKKTKSKACKQNRRTRLSSAPYMYMYIMRQIIALQDDYFEAKMRRMARNDLNQASRCFSIVFVLRHDSPLEGASHDTLSVLKGPLSRCKSDRPSFQSEVVCILVATFSPSRFSHQVLVQFYQFREYCQFYPGSRSGQGQGDQKR